MHKALVSKLLAHKTQKPKRQSFTALMSDSSFFRKGVLLLPPEKRNMANSAGVIANLERIASEGEGTEKRMAQAELQKWALIMGPTLKQMVEARTTNLKSNHSKQVNLVIAAQLQRAQVQPSKKGEILKLLKQKRDLALEESRNANSPTRKALFMEDFKAYAKAVEQISPKK
jgi:hypothetical protein